MALKFYGSDISASFLFWNPSQCDQNTSTSATDTYKGRLYEIIHRNLLAWEMLKQNIYCTVQYNTSNLPFLRGQNACSQFLGYFTGRHAYTNILLMPQQGQRQVRKHFKDAWFVNAVVTRELLLWWQLGIGSLLKIHSASWFIIIRVISCVKKWNNLRRET